MPRPRELDVYGYLDYRAYLRDFYETKKAAGRGFSFRSFSKRAGLKSPNYLKLVMDGDRNLTAAMAERFARACGLDDEATDFFCALVAFNQARNATERNAAYARLTGFRRYRQAHQLDLHHAAYHSNWYLPAIRELASRPDFREDPEWIAKLLVPHITRAEAREALDTLLELGLLERTDEGGLQQTENLVTTGPQTRGLHIGNYHRTMMGRAAASIDLVAAPDRDISSLTLCLSEDGLRTIKERIQRFRRELLELSALEDDPRQVIQINFQLFPLSRVEVE
ncbi:MAG: TIGR02147 family protein [Sandaracinus sp.]|nr:TIGR02147 family protein [Sandaracinus sp.]MCB9614045.1 TIGR02147 family protein [Sandaracinus sp.]MCB9620656.1 TIGR02147 family protein [Sandaracinus sp.]